MKKITILLLGLLVFGFAQAEASSPVPTAKGDWAWIFGFEGLSDLGVDGFQHPFAAGMRYFIGDELAIRPAVLFNIATDDDDVDDEKVTDTSIGGEFALESYLSSGKAVAPYIGGKANVSFAKTKFEEDTTEAEIKETTFGIAAIAGFQWGFTEGLSLGGEYSLGVNIGKEEEEVTVDNVTTTVADRSVTEFGISTVSLFLSVEM